MPVGSPQFWRSRGFAIGIHVGLWVLLFLVIRNLGGKAPDLQDSASSSALIQSVVPISKVEPLFLSAEWPKPVVLTNTPGLFFTKHFIPPPTPAPPPPPTTRKVAITYQGFFQAPDAPKSAVLKIAETLVVARIGTLVETNLYVADANMQELTLTNSAAQKHLVPLNARKEIEVPIR